MQLIVELNKGLTAAIHYYYARPYLIDYHRNNDNKYQILLANGSPEYFKSQEDVIAFFQNELLSGPVTAKARFSKAVFLQRKYKKRALELISGEMQLISDSINAIRDLTFSDANVLFEFCMPEPAF